MRGFGLVAGLVAAITLSGCQTSNRDVAEIPSTLEELPPGTYSGDWVAADGSPGIAESELQLDEVSAEGIAGVYRCRGCQGIDEFTMSFDVPRDGNEFDIPTQTVPMEFVIVDGEIQGRFERWIITYRM